MRNLAYLTAKRRAVAWLVRDGCDIDKTTPLVVVVCELEKRLAMTIEGELTKRFAARIINSVFAFGDDPRIKRRTI